MHPVRAGLAVRAASSSASGREYQSDLPIVDFDGIGVQGSQVRKRQGQEASKTQRTAPRECNMKTEFL